MPIMYGGTRIVILLGSKAYKFARFRPFRAVAQFVRHMLNGQVDQKLARFGESRLQAILNYLCGGINANKEEWEIWLCYQQSDMAQVHGLYLFGLLLVQERGQKLTLDDVPLQHRFWEMTLRHKNQSVEESLTQFALFPSGIKLVDFGRIDLDPGTFPVIMGGSV